ncbi:MAG: OmpH family outer membrane protein [Elusimicrobia bacterium]|nr:OmpH family outer membrane protein [Elusimicrobiota bacterium]
MTRTCVVLSSFILLASVPTRALELSLEENRAQRGSVGYVDMGRVFKLNPETFRAKESFEDAVRQAEEGVNIRKAEVMRLRSELAALKAEREVLAKAAAEAAAAQARLEAAAQAADALPEGDRDARPPASTAAQAAIASTQVPGSTFTAPAPTLPAASVPAAAAGVPEPPPPPSPKTPSPQETALADVDAKIEKKAAELTQKESEFKNLQAMAEKNLLDLESRKTEILLGKIHKAIMDVARKEGVSVVVDKNSILYGHEAVDLTEKVLQALRGG